MIKKKLFFTGSVFQFYIKEINKYAFCKFFDFTDISPFHGLLAKVYDKFSDSEENNIDVLKDCDWLFGYRSIHKWPNLRKDSGWKLVGTILSSDDETVPDFKGAQSFRTVIEDESKIGPWYAVHNLNQRSENKEYDSVKHLEQKILTTTSLGISWRTGMEYCRINNLNVADYYDLEEQGVRSMYYQMINVPVYSTIPLENRGRSL